MSVNSFFKEEKEKVDSTVAEWCMFPKYHLLLDVLCDNAET